MNQWKKRNNAGSTLMFIIIAVAFVGILATIILRVTLINVQTKSVDRSVKENFYTEEAAMDQVNLALQYISQEAMKKAYVSILSTYSAEDANASTSPSGQMNIQNRFAKEYLGNLISELSGGGSALNVSNQLVGEKLYQVSHIKSAMEAVMKEAMSADSSLEDYKKCLPEPKDANALQLELHYDPTNTTDTDYLLLKNLTVKYETDPSNKEGNQSTTVTTDIKMIVPNLNFEGGSIYPDFTKYCIIGDESVKTEGVHGSYANGNLYAGEYGLQVKGIYGTNNDATLTVGGSSSHLITRGDVEVFRMGKLVLGSDANPLTVWAENYKTSSVVGANTAEAVLEVHGNSYIHDDLSMDAPYSTVTLADGNYYGYTFNKDNVKDSKTVISPGHSSAIVINGRNSALAMQDSMTSVLLGGRAFVSRNEAYSKTSLNGDTSNIMLGQSISVKSDQSLYLVDSSYLSDGFKNPMSLSEYRSKYSEVSVLTANAKKALKPYLNASQPVTTYVYSLSSQENAGMVYFFYNFKNQSAADRFFQNRISETDLKKKALDTSYIRFGSEGLNGLRISPALSMFTMGNYYSFENSSEVDKSTVHEPTIDADNVEFYRTEAVNMAAEYKSYQLNLTNSLTNNYNTANSSEGDEGFDLTDKTQDRVFDEIMSKEDNGEYLFVEHAKKNNRDAYGFKQLTGIGSSSVMIKSVPVEIGSTKVYAIFVAETDASKFTAQNEEIGSQEVPVSLGAILDDANVAANETAIVVGNCNINVDRSMNGLVVSRHSVSYASSSVGITAQSALLQAMFSTQKGLEGGMTDESRKFLKYFEHFANLTYGADAADTDAVNFSRYI